MEDEEKRVAKAAFVTVPIKRGEVVFEQESILELNSQFSNLPPG